MISYRRGLRGRAERGSMAIELVLLVPVLVAVMLLVIGAGRFIDRQGDVEAAAREAARAASYERDYGSAQAAAQHAATQSLPSGLSCSPVDLSGTDFSAGGMIRVRVTCRADLSELGFSGLPGSVQLSGDSAAPLDQWRRTS
ncbi:TadE/TadG family type IV pilus assembly protein [Phytoactinopolyspora mesophila]|uniref:Pilus assembly protein n=1 Tax=Phytoactinopolyspora mesophila TaxID=2650750 RepID=A0A7K3M929_9ACTN|nr:TadE/TadG family type IV pilus assembly protein [Phytoactinopolyspora mesophila]NDL58918.1 pilus assembly protein [Phytoactinopolyspora mesophila]